MPDDQKPITLGEHLEPRVSRLETGLVGINKRLDRSEADTSRRFDEIARSLDGVISAINESRRPQYVAFIVGVVAAVGVLVSFVTLVTGPQGKAIDSQHRAISALRIDYLDMMRIDAAAGKKDGEIEASLDSLEGWLTRTSSKQIRDGERIARQEGEMEIVRQWLTAVDHIGSRLRLNTTNPE